MGDDLGAFIFTNFFGGILNGLSSKDFALPVGLLLWSPLYFYKFRTDLDFTEPFSGLIYAFYLAFSGMILVILCPMEFHRITDVKSWIIWFLFFFALGISRWMRRGVAQVKAAKQIIKKEE